MDFDRNWSEMGRHGSGLDFAETGRLCRDGLALPRRVGFAETGWLCRNHKWSKSSGMGLRRLPVCTDRSVSASGYDSCSRGVEISHLVPKYARIVKKYENRVRIRFYRNFNAENHDLNFDKIWPEMGRRGSVRAETLGK